MPEILALIGKISVRWWITGAFILTLLGYHAYAVYSADNRGYDRGRTEWEGKLNEVVAKAQAEHDNQQSVITARAEPENAELMAKFTEIKGQLDALKKLAPAKMPGKSAPVNCNADLARVQWVDEE